MQKLPLEILTPEKRNERNFRYLGNRPGSRTLNKKVRPVSRTFVSRLGYNSGCTSYTSDSSIDRLSGSSFNRHFQKLRKDELQKLREAKEEKEKQFGTEIDENTFREMVDGVRTNKDFEQVDQLEFSGPHDKREKRLHLLSSRTKGKLKDKCTAFFRACRSNKTFATITFIQMIEDRKAVKILNKFFTTIRKEKPDFEYVWVAERQENGNIHFHCIFNMRMDVRRYNALWVLCQYNEGLRFENVSLSEIRARYENDTIHEILNPFDIERVKSIYGISYYLTKYVTKNKTTEGFRCLAWHCSRNVSRLFTKTLVSRSCMRAVADRYKNFRVNKKTGEVFQRGMIKGCFYQLFFIEVR